MGYCCESVTGGWSWPAAEYANGVQSNALSKIQGLVHKNETGFCSKLAAQDILREGFDGALTGCRMTLAALGFELNLLIESKKGTKTTELSFQVAKARLGR